MRSSRKEHDSGRMRGGGKHKDKKGKAENKQVTSQKSVSNEGPAILDSEKEAIIRTWQENEGSRKFIEVIPEGSDDEMEQALQSYRTAGREVLGWDQGQADMMECGLRWAVEARRKGRWQQEEEQRRQEEQGQNSRQQREESAFRRRRTVGGDASAEHLRASGDGWR